MTSSDFVKINCSELRLTLVGLWNSEELPRFSSTLESCWSHLGCEKEEARALGRHDEEGKPIKIMIWSSVR